jgi:hypothetical protein
MSLISKIFLALEKLAIVFSCAVSSIIVLLLIGAGAGGFLLWQEVPRFPMPDSFDSVRDDVACKTIHDLNEIVENFDSAVIERTIHIDDQVPVVFDLPVEKNITVDLTDDVPLQGRPTTMSLPEQGGTINGWVSLTLPRGYRLPIHLKMTVAVSQSLPVQMEVPVTIPLKETDLGPVTGKLKDLAKPYLVYLADTLDCSLPESTEAPQAYK